MHEGFKILNLDSLNIEGGIYERQEMEIVRRFDGHESLAYGCDWDRGSIKEGDGDDEERRKVISCSFYDSMMHIWGS